MIEYIKRLARYVLSGQPKVTKEITVSVSKSPILSGKRILVTGGGKGIGFAIAKKCIESGASVVISGRNENTLKGACADVPGLKYVVNDVADINSHESLISECERLLSGSLDSLVNNAGISLHEGWYEAVTPESWDRQFNINLRGTYFLTQSFIRHLVDDASPKNIIFISSERGLYCDDIPYGLIKAAINSLTKGLGRRLLSRNIFVNAIAPGVTVSDMTGYAIGEDMSRPQSCSGRVYMPDEVAELAAFLLSDVSNCISSQIIPTQNGNHLRTDC